MRSGAVPTRTWLASALALVAGFTFAVSLGEIPEPARTAELEVSEVTVDSDRVDIAYAWHYKGERDDIAHYVFRVTQGGRVVAEREFEHNAGADAVGVGMAGSGFGLPETPSDRRYEWSMTARWEGSRDVLASIEGWFEAPCDGFESCGGYPVAPTPTGPESLIQRHHSG